VWTHHLPRSTRPPQRCRLCCQTCSKGSARGCTHDMPTDNQRAQSAPTQTLVRCTHIHAWLRLVPTQRLGQQTPDHFPHPTPSPIPLRTHTDYQQPYNNQTSSDTPSATAPLSVVVVAPHMEARVRGPIAQQGHQGATCCQRGSGATADTCLGSSSNRSRSRPTSAHPLGPSQPRASPGRLHPVSDIHRQRHTTPLHFGTRKVSASMNKEIRRIKLCRRGLLIHNLLQTKLGSPLVCPTAGDERRR
jgi:hypothetical protein